jgi:hypothetical protein
MIHASTIAKSNQSAVSVDDVQSISSDGIQAFCREYGSLDELREVVRIAAESFDAHSIQLSTVSDPEIRESWIEVAVDAKGDVQQLMEAEHRFTLRLREEVSGQMREHVRLYLTSADDCGPITSTARNISIFGAGCFTASAWAGWEISMRHCHSVDKVDIITPVRGYSA